MILNNRALKNVTIGAACLWTLVVALLTINLVYSSKDSTNADAANDAETVSSLLLSNLDKLNVVNSPKLILESINLGINSKHFSIPLGHDHIKAELLILGAFDLEKLYNKSSLKTESVKSQNDKIDITTLVKKTSDKQFVRHIKKIGTIENCAICRVLSPSSPGDSSVVLIISVELTQYISKWNIHAWTMIRNIAAIWLLGLIAIAYGYRKTKASISVQIRNYEESVYSLVDIIEKRDSYTAGHTRRVAKYSMIIANYLNLNGYDKDNLYRAAMLHDIGKISTPDSILLKPAKLSRLEYEIIQSHVTTSYEILSNVSLYKDIAEIARHHHEYFDGSGYPQGLKDEQIPFLSQILTVADAFDAMTTDRIYKPRKSVKEALIELSNLSGRQFNPRIVKAATKALSGLKVDQNHNQLPESDLQHERFSYFYKDSLTHVYNSRYLELLLYKQQHELRKFRVALLVRIHNFTEYNSQNGWSNGDLKLIEIANALKTLEDNHLVFRLFGDDFVVLLPAKIDEAEVEYLLKNELKGTCLYYYAQFINLENSEPLDIDELEKKLCGI